MSNEKKLKNGQTLFIGVCPFLSKMLNNRLIAAHLKNVLLFFSKIQPCFSIKLHADTAATAPSDIAVAS